MNSSHIRSPKETYRLTRVARGESGADLAVVNAILRSTGDADVASVARRLGGGGHVKAAGAVVPEGLEAAEARVLQEIREALS